MNHRIQAVLKHSGLNASDFANVIGVTKASISHILTGRNNPSLDFVQRVLSNFKEINADWMISGTGPMLKTSSDNLIRSHEVKLPPASGQKEIPQLFSTTGLDIEKSKSLESDWSVKGVPKSDESIKQEPVAKSFTNVVAKPKPAGNADSTKNIRRVILLYDDNTFSVYEADGL